MIEQNYIREILQDLTQQTENLILSQLNDLVSRDLLTVEKGPMSLVRSCSSDKIELRQTIKLTLKNKEYVEKLEKENEELIRIINNLKEVACQQKK